MGESIRLRNFASIVLTGSRCASACAVAWLGGTRRLMGEQARIGFHAASNADGRETGIGNALLGAYLNRIGLPYEAVMYITAASPDRVTWLDLKAAREVGIDVAVIEQNVATGPS